jgi:polysaccharide pyruvyl transferase WcaK-like protein
MTQPKKIILLNAYSRTNAGDGLLVDEAHLLIQQTFPGATVRLVSMAPDSFPEFEDGLNPIGGPSQEMTRVQLVRTLLTGRPHPAVAKAIDEADLAVAVGGGYLRAASFTGMLKTVLSHLSQAPHRSSRTPYVYLPQSIGPYPGPRIPLGLGRLRRAKAVFVRDDRSLKLARDFGMKVSRVPDMAALALARTLDGPMQPREVTHDTVAVVARSLGSKAARYDAQIKRLVELTNGELLVQSFGRGNDDPSYYRALGYSGDKAALKDVLADPARRPAVVVSVRLHGSLQAILAGVPSIHLSYERKGWGAYDDLGISRFVHNAKSFDLDLVLSQIEEIRRDPASYWALVDEAKPRLMAASEQLRKALVEAAK